MDSTLKEIQFVTTKNKYTIFYYKIPVSFGSPYVWKVVKVKQSRNRPGVAQRVPGGLGSQISMTFGS